MSGGWNPVNGRDASGNRPPLAPWGAPTPGAGEPYIPYTGGPGWGGGYGNFPLCGNYYTLAYPYNPLGNYYPFSYQPNGAGNIFARQPQPYPNIDASMPAAQMTNPSGGVGCEPGYNYFFPAEHTMVHVFKSQTPPWQLPAGAQIHFKASHIPCSVTLAELLKGFGCDSAAPKKNRCYEIIPGGNGTWYKGVNFSGGDKDMLKKTVKEIGWDQSRSGQPNEKPVVCLWFCKD